MRRTTRSRHDDRLGKTLERFTDSDSGDTGTGESRESPLGLIRLVANLAEAQLERLVGDLQAGEFIYEQPAATSVEYVFKHALTQEVAYNSLLIERRKQIHEHAGQALEAIFAGHLDDHLSQLAHHYSHTDNLDKAIEYLGGAGRQALQRSAHVEAISGFNAAIALLQRLPDSPERQRKELPLQMALGATLIATKGWAASEIEQINTRCLELCKQLGDPPETFSVMFGAYAFYLLRADLRIAHQLAGQLLQRARLSNDSTLLLLAYQALGQSSIQQGQLLNAKEYFELALSFYDHAVHSPLAIVFGIDLGVAALSYLAETFWYLGYPDKARGRSDEALALASALSHPHTLAFADFFAVLSVNFFWNHVWLKRLLKAQSPFPQNMALPQCWLLRLFSAAGRWPNKKKGSRDRGNAGS